MKRTVTLSIKNVPQELVEMLREQAARNHRSLQGELMAIIEESAYRNNLSPQDLLKVVRTSGLFDHKNGSDMSGKYLHVRTGG